MYNPNSEGAGLLILEFAGKGSWANEAKVDKAGDDG
jgi:hypothetical protein